VRLEVGGSKSSFFCFAVFDFFYFFSGHRFVRADGMTRS